MHTPIKSQLGVRFANCVNCKYCSTENGYAECLKEKPKANLRSFPFIKEQDCWAPTFWKTSLIFYLSKFAWINNIVYHHYEVTVGECIGGKCKELTRFETLAYKFYFKNKLTKGVTLGKEKISN